MPDPFADLAPVAPAAAVRKPGPPAGDPFAAGTDPFADTNAAPAAAPAAPADSPGWGDYAGLVARGVGGFLGSEGTWLGAGINGAADLVGQALERVGGHRKAFNLAETGTSAAIGAIPFGKEGQLALRLLRGSAMGGGSAAAMDVASQLGDQTDNPGFDLRRTAHAAETGLVLGGAGGAIAEGATRLLNRGAGTGSGSAAVAALRNEGKEAVQAWGGRAQSKAPAAAERLLPTAPPQTRYMPPPDEIASMAGDGGPGLPAPASGPLSRTEQILGIDPARLRPGAAGTSNAPVTPPPPPLPPYLTPATEAGGSAASMEADPGFARRATDQARAYSNRFLQALGMDPAALDRPATREGGSPILGGRRAADVVPAAAGVAGDEAGVRGTGTSAVAEAAEMAGAGETGMQNAARRGRPFVPGELYSTWQDLQPRWAATQAATGVNQHEDLPFFAQRVLKADNPRKLMGAERKAVKLARGRLGDIPSGDTNIAAGTGRLESPPAVQEGGFADQFGGEDRSLDDAVGRHYDDGGTADPHGESGAIDPALLQKLGIHVAGAAAGSLAGSQFADPENRTRDTIGGGILGALAPTLATNPTALNSLRYFSLLGKTSAQAKNLVGNAGSAAVKAAELALGGDRPAAGNLLREFFSRDTAEGLADAFRHAPDANPNATRWGGTAGVLGLPSRLMHAVDEAATGALERGGLSEDDARTSLFTATPKSKAGQWMASRPEAFSIPVPFAKTATNMVERGLEHTPGVGYLPAVRAMRGATLKEATIRQAMGLAAGTAAAAGVGGGNPYIGTMLGPLGMPYELALAAKAGADRRKGDPIRNVADAATGAFAKGLPLPTDAYNFTAGNTLATLVPGFLADASIDRPSDFETSGSIFNPAISKIPFLNAALLKRKRKAR